MPRSPCSTQAASSRGLMFSAGRNDPAAQHRHVVEYCRWRMSTDEGFEALGLVGRYIEEIERGCPRGQFIRELPAKVAIDLDNGHQQRDTKPKREHNCRGQRAR